MKLKSFLIGGLLISIAVFFRFHNFFSLFHWTMDEEFWSYLPWNIASLYHLPLIGGHIGGTGLYSGPTFIYLIAVVAKVFSGNPYGFGFFVSVIGVLTCFLIFQLGQKMFDKKISFIAAFLYASSFLMAIFDRHYWNASLTPLLSLLTLYSVWKIKSGSNKWAIVLSFVLILAFHAHGTGMALIIFSVVSWLIFRLPLRSKFTLLAIAIFLAGQLPLIFFDLRHNFQISRALPSYFTKEKQVKIPLANRVGNILYGFTAASSRLIYFVPNDLAIEQSLCVNYRTLKGRSPWPVIALSLFSLFYVAFIFVSGRHKSSLNNYQGLALSVTLIFCTLLGLTVYNEFLPEYFLSPTFIPLFFLYALTIVSVTKRLRTKYIIPIILSVFLIGNLSILLSARRSFPLGQKIEAAHLVISQAAGKPFSIEVRSSDPCQIYGIRYLFTYLGTEPAVSYMDPYFLWLYEKRLQKVKPDKQFQLTIFPRSISVKEVDW